VLLLQAIGGAVFQQNLDLGTLEDQMQNPFAVWAAIFTPTYFLVLFLGVVGYFLILAISFSYVMLYLETGRRAEVDEVWSRFKEDAGVNFSTWLGLFLLFMLLVLVNVVPCLGQLVFIAAGIYFGVVFSILWTVRLRERVSFTAAMNRSRDLVRGFFGPTFGLAFLLVFVMVVVSMMFSIPAYVVGFASGLNALSGSVGSTPFFVALLTGLCGLVGSFTAALYPIAYTLHYYNLVERKEATGLSDRVDAWGSRTGE
jgi:hypothetical protein